MLCRENLRSIGEIQPSLQKRSQTLGWVKGDVDHLM